MVAAVTSHLICARSAPRARRSRMIKLAAEAMMAIGNQANATWRNCAPSTPNTLRTPGELSISPGPSRIPMEINTRSMAVTHANHRHRGDGRCPSGNSRRRKVIAMPNDGSHSHCDNETITAPPGSPGRT